MTTLQGILFHTLKGSPGWSDLAIKKVDVGRIAEMSYQKRLFCLFDRDKPYTLAIVYYLPKTNTSLAPTLGHSVGITIYDRTIVEHVITKRYTSEQEVQAEIAAIEKKISKLKSYQKRLAEEL